MPPITPPYWRPDQLTKSDPRTCVPKLAVWKLGNSWAGSRLAAPCPSQFVLTAGRQCSLETSHDRRCVLSLWYTTNPLCWWSRVWNWHDRARWLVSLRRNYRDGCAPHHPALQIGKHRKTKTNRKQQMTFSLFDLAWQLETARLNSNFASPLMSLWTWRFRSLFNRVDFFSFYEDKVIWSFQKSKLNTCFSSSVSANCNCGLLKKFEWNFWVL